MSRKGQLWRGELAAEIQGYLDGAIDVADLIAWAMDHPFFEDRSDLDQDDQRRIGHALGSILALDPWEPAATRTDAAALAEAGAALLGH